MISAFAAFSAIIMLSVPVAAQESQPAAKNGPSEDALKAAVVGALDNWSSLKAVKTDDMTMIVSSQAAVRINAIIIPAGTKFGVILGTHTAKETANGMIIERATVFGRDIDAGEISDSSGDVSFYMKLADGTIMIGDDLRFSMATDPNGNLKAVKIILMKADVEAAQMELRPQAQAK